MDYNQTISFIWNIANLIRDHYRRSKYPDVILPFTVLRRIDCVLAPTKDWVLETYNKFDDEFIRTPYRIVKVYDSCYGTGGMLTIIE